MTDSTPVELASVVLFTKHLDRTVAFYRALGVPLDDEDHGDGVVHRAAEVGGVHLAVFAAESPDDGRFEDADSGDAGGGVGWRTAGSTFVGFWVLSLEATTAAIAALGADVLLEHQDRPWGCRVVVADPDGRAVEINQRSHCPPSDAS